MTVVQPRIEPSIQDWGRPKVLTIEKKKKKKTYSGGCTSLTMCLHAQEY